MNVRNFFLIKIAIVVEKVCNFVRTKTL